MNRKVLIEVVRTPNDEYATLVMRMADQDRTPVLTLRVHAPSLGSQLCWYPNGVEPKVDAEIVPR